VSAQILALLENPHDAELLCKSLGGPKGHTVIVCKNFNHAISVLKSQRVDLVISDVHLENGGNVFEFLKWVRTTPETSATLFVLCSINPDYVARYVEDGLRLCARALGATKYIKMDRFQSEDFRLQIDALLPRNKQTIGDLLKEEHVIIETGG
jgi:CheY-like chemotaxis protein